MGVGETHSLFPLSTSFSKVANLGESIKNDAENLELYLLGDLNCNLSPDIAVDNNSSYLLNIMDIYGLTQLITESTRVTQYSHTLIDLCVTNSP